MVETRNTKNARHREKVEEQLQYGTVQNSTVQSVKKVAAPHAPINYNPAPDPPRHHQQR